MLSDYQKNFQASLFIAISGILYGFLGYLGTSIIKENFSISTMLFWRFFIAGTWMLFFALKNHSAKKASVINKRVLFFMFVLGAIGYGGTSAFYFLACQYTGTGLAMVIFFSYPVVVALLSWMIYKKKFNITTIFVLLTMSVGLFLLDNSSKHPFNIIGIFFGITSAICYAFYVIGSKKYSAIKIDSRILSMMVCFGCAFIFLLSAVLTHSFTLPLLSKTWLSLLILGIVATALPIQLMLEGLKYVSSMRASIISVLEPLVTVFVGVLLLHESVSHLQMLGTMIILGSAILIQFQKEL